MWGGREVCCQTPFCTTALGVNSTCVHVCECAFRSELSREKGILECKKIYCKELAHMNMEAGKSKLCRVGQQTRDPGEPMCSSNPTAVCCRIEKSRCCRWSPRAAGWGILYWTLQLTRCSPPTLFPFLKDHPLNDNLI